jgi:hypothetical protein
LHVPGGETLAHTMRRYMISGNLRIGHSGGPAASPAGRVDGTANNAGMGSNCGVDVVAREGDDRLAVLELHLPTGKGRNAGSELCAVLDPKCCTAPGVMAPPGYTGRDKRDFLDKAGKYLDHCHAAVTPARAAEVAQQLDQYRAALPAGQRWRLGTGERGKKARLQLASALESLSTMVQHNHGRHHSSKKFVLPTEGFEATHPAQTTCALADCGASVNLVHDKTILQMGGQIDYNGVKFKFTKCASQELGGLSWAVRAGHMRAATRQL